jgi:hypothetical protein
MFDESLFFKISPVILHSLRARNFGTTRAKVPSINRIAKPQISGKPMRQARDFIDPGTLAKHWRAEPLLRRSTR